MTNSYRLTGHAVSRFAVYMTTPLQATAGSSIRLVRLKPKGQGPDQPVKKKF